MKQRYDRSYFFNSLMTEDKKDYYQSYIDGQIDFKDIPTESLSGKILIYAMEKEPDKIIEFLLDLSEQKKINLDILKYLKMIPNNLMKDEYYDRYFELNPLKNYLKLPISRRTMKMALRIIEISPNNIEYLLDKHKSREICNRAFAYDIHLIKYIPLENITKDMCEKTIDFDSSLLEYLPKKYITEEMYEKYIIDNAKSARVSIYLASVNELHKNREIYLGFLKNVPSKYITKKTYEEIFRLNPLLFVAFPDDIKTDEMCRRIYDIYGKRVIEFIPISKRWASIYKDDISGKSIDEIKEFYYNLFSVNPLENIDYIPLEYRNQSVYDKLFDVGGIAILDKIPNEFRTKKMWDSVVFNAKDGSILKEIPDKFISRDMCEYLYAIYGIKALYFIPKRFLTKEMYVKLINDNIYDNLELLSVDLLDEEILSIIVVKLKKIIKEGKTINASFEVISTLVNVYPFLIRAFNKEVINKIIIKELYLIKLNGGTIENIAKKYEITVSMINTILESLRDTDSETYNNIKSILDMNQDKWLFNMQNDIYNLDIIINLVNIDNSNKLNIIQKTKFAYLYFKYINNSLDDIYNFNYKKYSKINCLVIDKFFRDILRYNYLSNDGNDVGTMLDSDMIKPNNSWLNSYDRNKFFAIKNDKITMEHRYGKSEQLLTLEIEQKVIDELTKNGIPLNDTIVQVAFREYFNNNLDGYIEQFRVYDQEFEAVKKGRGRR